jgi:hypothetical protein
METTMVKQAGDAELRERTREVQGGCCRTEETKGKSWQERGRKAAAEERKAASISESA